MTQTLASDMVQRGLTVLLERTRQQREFSADEARQLIDSCEIGFILVERIWNLAQGFLDRGMEGRKLAFLLKESLDIFALSVEAFEAARSKVEASGLAEEEKNAGSAGLEKWSRRAEKMRDELSSLLRWLETLPPAVNPSSLPGGRENREAAGYVDLDDLTARLLSGGGE
jgi:hypothetical protein